jgi:PGM1 C-terminal domain
LLGGEGNQVFLGALFPADKAYASEIAAQTMPLCHLLQSKGVIGRFSVDFLSVKENDTWKHYAIEINMRKGGTTHPFLMLMFLTEGTYNAETAEYRMKNGQSRYYLASDNFVDDACLGLTPHDLIEIAMDNKLMFNGATQQGVMFHMISALSQYGKMGILAIAATPEQAYEYYRRTVDVLQASRIT